MADVNLTFEPINGTTRAAAVQRAVEPPVRPAPAPEPTKETPPRAERAVEDFSAEELRNIAAAFGEVVALVNRELRIEIDESTDRIITQIVDGKTNEVLRQVPPEALLDAARRVAALVGLLLDEDS